MSSNPDPTLEKQIEHTINELQDWGFDDTNMEYVVQALLSLYQKELVRELETLKTKYFYPDGDYDGGGGVVDLDDIDERIRKALDATD